MTAAPIAYRLAGVGATLGRSARPRQVLSDLDMVIRNGEIVAVVGRSGVGKTTLLRVLGGLLPVTAGTVSLDGRPVTAPPPEAVMVFQDYANALLPWRTVARNVALGLERRVPAAERRRRVAEALRLVGLPDRDDEHPHQLSGGAAQRVQIARALALRPKVLLMDEPFGSLDALTRASLQDVLLNAHDSTGRTIVFVTHDLDEALYLADRVLVLAGTPAAVVLDVAAELPRPRNQITTRESARFLRARHELVAALDAADG